MNKYKGTKTEQAIRGGKNIAERAKSIGIESVVFDRNTFEGLNLEAVDPSECFINFEHNMKFSKTKGFSSVLN